MIDLVMRKTMAQSKGKINKKIQRMLAMMIVSLRGMVNCGARHEKKKKN